MNIHLISTYNMGRQPFGLASPAAWLRDAGFEVTCTDCAIEPFPAAAIANTDIIAFYLPMHTATRLAVPLAQRARKLHPGIKLCFYGLYAPTNADYLKSLGADIIIGGEYEEELVKALKRLQANQPTENPQTNMGRQQFRVPDRSALPSPNRYAKLLTSEGKQRITGYTQTTRGCKHTCRHCPIVPVYNGHFRVIQKDVVMADIRQQVENGVEHITFGDPDFLNGPGHSIHIIEAMHQEFPHLTYDVTIKVEHLVKHRQRLPIFKDSGCAFITTAVESMDDAVLQIFDKGHTHSQFVEVVSAFRDLNLVMNPTFVAFHPWMDTEAYLRFLETIVELDLIEHVAPIQLAIRLLIPNASKLLDVPATRKVISHYDAAALVHQWQHPDPQVDALQQTIEDIVDKLTASGASRAEIFGHVWEVAHKFAGKNPIPSMQLEIADRATVPYLNEPWYC